MAELRFVGYLTFVFLKKGGLSAWTRHVGCRCSGLLEQKWEEVETVHCFALQMHEPCIQLDEVFFDRIYRIKQDLIMPASPPCVCKSAEPPGAGYA